MENHFKKTFFQGLVGQKCPHCRNANLFEYSGFNLMNFSTMHKSCTHCGQDFVIEPGFYTGAMYFSYAFNVAILLVVGLGANILFDLHVYTLTALVIGVSLVTMPFNFRYSRVLMLYFFSGIEYKNK